MNIVKIAANLFFVMKFAPRNRNNHATAFAGRQSVVLEWRIQVITANRMKGTADVEHSAGEGFVAMGLLENAKDGHALHFGESGDGQGRPGWLCIRPRHFAPALLLRQALPQGRRGARTNSTAARARTPYKQPKDIRERSRTCRSRLTTG